MLTCGMQVFKLPFFHYLCFDIFRTLAGSGFNVSRVFFKDLPVGFGNVVGQLFQVFPGIHAKDEGTALIPSVKMFTEAKVSISSNGYFFEGAFRKVQGFIHPLGRPQMRR